MAERTEYLDLIRGDEFLNRLMMSYDNACLSSQGRTVLDYGCGYGWGSYQLSQYARQVIGYDSDNSRIQFARTVFQKRNIIYLAEADYLSGRCFDMVCLFLVLPSTKEPQKVLNHVNEYLVPGGTLWISFKSGDDWLEELVANWVSCRKIRLLDSSRRYLTEGIDLVEQVWQTS